MSSYMAQLSLGHFCKDMPDFLTCGFCAKEFLLENITLFIAHKFGCADKIPQSSDIEDTTSPLTCSVCSRVFMTARGLLQHVQLDHKMKIYIQKGPLLITNVSARLPPPAHLFPTKGGDYSTTNTPNCPPNCPSGPLETCETELPTDLSLPCQTPGEKSPEYGDKDRAFKITDDVGAKEKTSNSASALPKKRKFLLHENGQEASPASANTPSLCSSESIGGEDIGVFSNDNPEICEEVLSSDLPVEKYHSKDSTNARRNEKERHVKLKELLQRGQTSEQETHFGDTFPCAVLKQEPEEVSNDAPTVTAVDGRGVRSDSAAMSRMPSARFKPGFTIEQNIEQLIRASVSDDTFCEDYGTVNTKQASVRREAGSGVPLPASSLTQRLHTPGDRYTPYLQTQINSDLSSKTNVDLGHLMPPKLEDSPFDLRLNQSAPYALTKLPSPSTNRPLTSAQSSSFYSGKSYSFSGSLEPPSDLKGHTQTSKPTLETQLSDPSGHAHYQRRVASVKELDSSPSRQFQHHRHSSDDGREKTFSGQHLSNVRGFESQPLSYFEGHVLLDNVKEKEDTPNIAEKRNNMAVTTLSVSQFRHTRTSRSHSESLEESGPQTTDVQSRMDTDELQMLDAKLMKKRRYPTSRPFKCIHCDQAFNQRIHLKKHMSKHTGVKPFKCQQCDYSTVERSHLKVHYRIHTGEKPYRCLFCDYATAQNSTLKIHLKRHHEGINSISSRGRDSFLAQGIRDDDDNLFNDNYNLGLSTDSEGGAASQATTILGQEYPCTFSDAGRSEYTTTAHSKLDSVVGHFSFFSKEKDNSYSYTKNTFFNHVTNQMSHGPFDSKNMIVTTDHIDSSRVNFRKSQQCDVSNSILMRNMVKIPLKESISENSKLRSPDKSPVKTSDVDTIYQSKNEHCEKACPLQNIEIQTTPKQDYRPNLESKFVLNQGKHFSPSPGKDFIATHCKDYQSLKNGSNLRMEECGLHHQNYMTEPQSVYQGFSNVSKNNSEREHNMKEEESKEELKYFDPYLKVKDHQRPEQQNNVVNNKTEHGLNQESFEDNDDGSDLDYNIGLPTVNIPNKEFVRG